MLAHIYQPSYGIMKITVPQTLDLGVAETQIYQNNFRLYGIDQYYNYYDLVSTIACSLLLHLKNHRAADTNYGSCSYRVFFHWHFEISIDPILLARFSSPCLDIMKLSVPQSENRELLIFEYISI